MYINIYILYFTSHSPPYTYRYLPGPRPSQELHVGPHWPCAARFKFSSPLSPQHLSARATRGFLHTWCTCHWLNSTRQGMSLAFMGPSGLPKQVLDSSLCHLSSAWSEPKEAAQRCRAKSCSAALLAKKVVEGPEDQHPAPLALALN